MLGAWGFGQGQRIDCQEVSWFLVGPIETQNRSLCRGSEKAKCISQITLGNRKRSPLIGFTQQDVRGRRTDR